MHPIQNLCNGAGGPIAIILHGVHNTSVQTHSKGNQVADENKAATIGIKEISEGKRSDLYKVKVTDLHVKEGWNVRENDFNIADEDDKALAESIAAVGVKEPLTGIVEDGKLFVTNGHRRRGAALYAIEHLGAPADMRVSVQTEGRGADEKDQVLSMITRNSGKPLSALEMGKVCSRLIGCGMTEVEIGAKIGRTRQQVTNWLELNAAPAEVKTMVAAGEVSASLAAKEVRKNKGDKSKATATLKKGVEAAKKAGKSKATPKHMKPAAEKKTAAEPAPVPQPGGEPGDPPLVPATPVKERRLAGVADREVLKAVLSNADRTKGGYKIEVEITNDEFEALKRCSNHP